MAFARGLPSIERPVKEKEEMELYMRMRGDYLKENRDGEFEISREGFVQFYLDWNRDHAFPGHHVDEEGRTSYPGPIHLKLPRHLQEYEESVRVVQLDKRRQESAPGGLQGQQAWVGGLSKAVFPLPVQQPTPMGTLPSHPTPAHVFLNPAAIMGSNVLFQDAIAEHQQRFLANSRVPLGQLGPAPPLPKSKKSIALTGRKKYCETCFLHKVKETGHGNHPCHYGEKMCEYKGGPLLPGKQIRLQ